VIYTISDSGKITALRAVALPSAPAPAREQAPEAAAPEATEPAPPPGS
jgi:hypothetical protein